MTKTIKALLQEGTIKKETAQRPYRANGTDVSGTKNSEEASPPYSSTRRKGRKMKKEAKVGTPTKT